MPAAPPRRTLPPMDALLTAPLTPADVVLRDGSTMRLRAPEREDAEALLTFFRGLSEESLYRRFHGHPSVDARLIDPLLDPEWRERGALVGAHEDRIVAVANYVRLRD